ncbi:phosphotransferase [Lactobacillus sp. S2-2]|uniref:fructosamine kinase family protein n=1 Tax=Lactobacillus sp. S2-2 TaxID=2692917 RepID=UPI001F868ED4|nr:phosphotransferase [Lactobacillus sp. S2-2]
MNQEWLNQLPFENVNKVTPVSGGDVNQAYHLVADQKSYFLLVQPNQDKNFYAGEIAGLQEFSKNKINAPKVISNGEINHDAYLIISYIEKGNTNQRALGKLVAKMHQVINPAKKFGFEINSKGRDITFDNQWTDSWAELFVEKRLDALKDKIINQNLFDATDAQQYLLVRKVILEKLSKHSSQPSLLHGDLWGGNYLFDNNDDPILIDPAVFYGDREFDLGVTTVFGGYNQDFYDSYNEAYPIDDGYNERVHFYRLYYLMLHLLKFGNIYYDSVVREMKIILD